MGSEHSGRRANGALTPKQQAFVDEYVISRSISKATRAGGYKSDWEGPLILQSKAVAAAISARLEDLRRRNCHFEDQVVIGLAKIAFPSNEEKVRKADTLRALELLGKYLSIWGTDSVKNPEVAQAVGIVVETGIPKPPGGQCEDFTDL